MTFAAALLLVCSHADTEVIAAVQAAAVTHGVPVPLALAVCAVESGCYGGNPMGVAQCTQGARVADERKRRLCAGKTDADCGARPQPLGAQDCVTIGAVSLANRLRAAGGDERKALRIYNRSAHAAKYAAKVLRIARFVRGKR